MATMEQSNPPAARRGRPRSAASEQAILHATLDLLAEGQGPSTISIAAIAKRAGAGKDTIYRRWPNKEDLLLDALASLQQPLDPCAGAGAREMIVEMLAEVIARMQQPRDRAISRGLQSTDNEFPRLRERYYEQVIAKRREFVRDRVLAAVRAGELEVDEDAIGLIQMAFHHVLMSALEGNPVGGDPREAAERLVDVILYGIAGR